MAQSGNDYSDILRLALDLYAKESINVYSRFENSEIEAELERVKSDNARQQYDLFGADFDLVTPGMYDDTVTVVMDKIKLLYFEQKKKTIETANKRISRFIKFNFEKNRKKRPLAFISIPVISLDREKAIVYCYYVCGNLCGEGGTLYFKKENNKWILTNYIHRWIS